jgi:hypothetical protein
MHPDAGISFKSLHLVNCIIKVAHHLEKEQVHIVPSLVEHHGQVRGLRIDRLIRLEDRDGLSFAVFHAVLI